jgi:hypothetical protein
MDTVVRVAEGT